MSEMKHTPLPWLEIEADEYAGASWINIYVPQTNKFLVSQQPVEVRATDDDLAFIVTACNSHYDNLATISSLKAGNERLREALEHVAWSGKFECFDDASWDIVNDALTKQEG